MQLGFDEISKFPLALQWQPPPGNMFHCMLWLWNQCGKLHTDTRNQHATCRQGMARAMLDACHKLLCSKGSPAVWLHVRVADKVAYQLYQSAMYEEVARDKSGLFGPANMRPRILMKKTLSS